MLIDVTTPLAPFVLAASAHGLTDALRPRVALAYGAALAPFPAGLVTPAFVVASTLHFAEDVGLSRSARMHATFVAVAALDPDCAWSLFALFYCLVHAPLHVRRQTPPVRARVAACACAVLALALACHVDGFQLNDTLQKGVVVHCALASASVRPRRTRS